MRSVTAPAAAFPGWMGAALCAETDPELFFPDKGHARGAKRVCRACPVTAE